MAAHAREPVIGEHSLDLLAVGQHREVAVSNRRAHLNFLHANVGERFGKAGEVPFLNHLAMRPGLASYRQAQRIGAERRGAGCEDSGGGGICRGPSQEIASRHCIHRCLFSWTRRYRASVNAYNESPAPITTNWRPSSMKVIGAFDGVA